MTIEEVIQISGASTLLLAVSDVLDQANPWLPMIRELGSFGLIAFIVYWYATKIAPKAQTEFLTALGVQRGDYIAAQRDARDSYLASQKEDREAMLRLTAAMENLVTAVRENSRQQNISNAL